jgi:hypothetical protein
MQAHENATSTKQANDQTNLADTESVNPSNIDSNPKI